MLKKYFAALAGFLMITVIGLTGAVGAQAGGKDHKSIDEVITKSATCVSDGEIHVKTEGHGKHGYIYRYDVVPGQDNGYSKLDEAETDLAAGDYEVQLLKRKKGQGSDDWKVYESTTVTVGHNCVTVEASGDCETVTVTYANTTDYPYWGDVRVDGEAGEADEWSTTVKSQGPPPLTAFGLRYQDVEIPAGSAATHTVNFEEDTGEHTVEYRVARGPERMYYSIGWDEITVDCGEPEPPQDGQDGSDGEDGQDGQDGADGSDGKDGEDGEDGEDGDDGEVTVVTETVEVPTRINTGR